MAIAFRTGRGWYLLDLAGSIEATADAIILPLKLEHQGGIERVVLRCRIARALLDRPSAEHSAAALEWLAPRIEREFEQVREQALKSIRNDKRLFELSFDQGVAGPL